MNLINIQLKEIFPIYKDKPRIPKVFEGKVITEKRGIFTQQMKDGFHNTPEIYFSYVPFHENNLKPKLTIVKRICYEKDIEKYLHSVMTCQNYLKFPEYKSYEIFKEKLEYAINESKNLFGFS